LEHSDVTAVVTGSSRSAPHLTLAREAMKVELSRAEFAEIDKWFTVAAGTTGH